MTKNALILTWSGFQDHELVYPYYRLLGDGFTASIVADKRDSQNRIFGILGLNMPCHILIEDFNKRTDELFDSSDLLVLPGGVKSLEKLRQEVIVKEFIKKWHEAGKLITSTCHGAQMLISARITKGKTIAGYYSLQDDIENSGATYSREPVVVDGNIVTSPHYDFMGEWMETTLETYYKNHA
jgi:protease I